MREPAATRSHYKNLIDDLCAARVGTFNINVSSRAVVSSRPNTPGDSGKRATMFEQRFYTDDRRRTIKRSLRVPPHT